MTATAHSHQKDESTAGLGDPETWVDRYGDGLLRYALTRVGDRSTAEDLVQETLLAAWRGRSGYSGSCSAETWLTSILKRRVADDFRRRGRRPPTVPEHLLDSPPPSPRGVGPDHEAAEFWSVVSGCTGDMPDHLARAFRLRTFGEEAPATICDAEGISRKNLSVRLHRARQLLRRCLETRWFSGE